MKRAPFSAKRCKCGRRPLRRQSHCRKCRNEWNRLWRFKHPLPLFAVEREKALGRYRVKGLLPAGKCECGRPAPARLLDILDPASVYFRCAACWLKDRWRRKRAREGKVQPAIDKPRRVYRFSPDHMARLNEGLQRWRAERLKQPESREAVAA